MSDMMKELAITVEVTGTELSKGAVQVFEETLKRYPQDAVIKALQKCRVEITGKLSLAHIIQRIDDGRPGAEQAWAMIPKDEETTAVMTQEMLTAWGVASSLYYEGDEVAARMAFRETYTRDCEQARACNIAVAWKVSLGHAKDGRADPIIEAVRSGRITHERALSHLHDDKSIRQLAALQQNKPQPPEAIA